MCLCCCRFTTKTFHHFEKDETERFIVADKMHIFRGHNKIQILSIKRVFSLPLPAVVFTNKIKQIKSWSFLSVWNVTDTQGGEDEKWKSKEKKRKNGHKRWKPFRRIWIDLITIDKIISYIIKEDKKCQSSKREEGTNKTPPFVTPSRIWYSVSFKCKAASIASL